ncbi:unnamed protein product [Citrullus colocynthis]|uniref:Uncharacterized protein n=1 Tax=Citrullus colocynthis TaxID=252529 RepID=A0ABP0Y6I4_9ROSI
MEITRLPIRILVLFLAAISARSEYYSIPAPRVQLKEKRRRNGALKRHHHHRRPIGGFYAVKPLREGPDPKSKVKGKDRAYLGMKFGTLTEVRDAIRQYSMRGGYELIYQKNELRRITREISKRVQLESKVDGNGKAWRQLRGNLPSYGIIVKN